MTDRTRFGPAETTSTKSVGDDDNFVYITVLRYGTNIYKLNFTDEDVLYEEKVLMPLDVTPEYVVQGIVDCVNKALPDYQGIWVPFCLPADIRRSIIHMAMKRLAGQYVTSDKPPVGAILHTLGRVYVLILEQPIPPGRASGPRIIDRLLGSASDLPHPPPLTPRPPPPPKMASDQGKEPDAKKCRFEPQPTKPSSSQPKLTAGLSQMRPPERPWNAQSNGPRASPRLLAHGSVRKRPASAQRRPPLLQAALQIRKPPSVAQRATSASPVKALRARKRPFYAIYSDEDGNGDDDENKDVHLSRPIHLEDVWQFVLDEVDRLQRQKRRQQT